MYTRIDAPARPPRRRAQALAPEAVTATKLAGDPITAKLTRAPGNGAAIGGLKVTTAQGWFAARPSGTENVYKLLRRELSGPHAPRAYRGGGAGDGRDLVVVV